MEAQLNNQDSNGSKIKDNFDDINNKKIPTIPSPLDGFQDISSYQITQIPEISEYGVAHDKNSISDLYFFDAHENLPQKIDHATKLTLDISKYVPMNQKMITGTKLHHYWQILTIMSLLDTTKHLIPLLLRCQ